MKHVVCVVFAAATALSPACVFGQAGSDKHVMVPPSVAKLVAPILDAAEEAHEGPQPMIEEKGSSLWRVSALMGKLFDNKSPASDEALVALLYYYLGEANGEDQFQEIICRGKRMLPYLGKYRSHFPDIPNRHYRKEILLESETVSEKFRDVTDEIKKGHSAIACQSRP